MVKTEMIRDDAGKFVGKREDHYQLYKKWTPLGEFQTRDGRRFNYIWRYKWSR